VPGTVIAWGYNGSGQVTVPEAARSGVTAIAAGAAHSLALTRFGEVIAWGTDYYGQLTVPEAARSGVTAIAAGAFHSLVLRPVGVFLRLLCGFRGLRGMGRLVCRGVWWRGRSWPPRLR